MCLDYELTKNQADKIKAQARKRGYIRVWKVCRNFGRRSTGTVYGIPYKKGVCKATLHPRADGDLGWYCYLTKKGAIHGAGLFPQDVKVCYAKPSWRKGVGKFCNKPAATFTHLAFPDWDKGDMTTREFRAMCRENK